MRLAKLLESLGFMGLVLSLTHTRCLPCSPFFLRSFLEPIALAYLLCIMGRSVPEDRLGWEERPEERSGSQGRETKESSAQGSLCCSWPKVPQVSIVMTVRVRVCVCVICVCACIKKWSRAAAKRRLRDTLRALRTRQNVEYTRRYTTLSAPLIVGYESERECVRSFVTHKGLHTVTLRGLMIHYGIKRWPPHDKPSHLGSRASWLRLG